MGWVLDHSPTKGSDRLVLLSLANHAGQTPTSDEHGLVAWEAWPGVETLQREAGLDRTRTVQEALGRLEGAGHIVRVVNGAPDSRIRKDRRPNLYRIVIDHGVLCSDTRCRWCGVPDSDIPKGDHGVPSRAERGAASRHHGVPSDDITGCRKTAPEPSVEPLLQPSEEPSLAELDLGDTERQPTFSDFWAAVPKARRIGKRDAEKAWTRAIKRAGPAEIIAGMTRYATETAGRESRFIKSPAPWLNADRWLDEPGANRDTKKPTRTIDDRREAPSGRVAPEEL